MKMNCTFFPVGSVLIACLNPQSIFAHLLGLPTYPIYHVSTGFSNRIGIVSDGHTSRQRSRGVIDFRLETVIDGRAVLFATFTEPYQNTSI